MSAGKQPGTGQSRAPRRKRIVLADRRGTRDVTRTMVEPEEQHSAGEDMIDGLVRTQLRSSLILAGVTLGALGALPLLFAVVPGLARAQLLGVPLPWLLLGVLPFPFILLIGYLSMRWAEHHEREFTDMVDRSS